MPKKNSSIWGSQKSERMASKYRKPRGRPSGSNHLGEAYMNYPKTDPTLDVVNTFGPCKNTFQRVRRNGRWTTKCKAFHVELGNGLCMDCWDKTVERRANDPEIRKGKDYKTSLPQE